METFDEFENKILHFDWDNLSHESLIDTLREFYFEFVGNDDEFQDIREKQFEELLDILKRKKLVPDDIGIEDVSSDDSSDDKSGEKRSKRTHRHRKRSARSGDKSRDRSRSKERSRSRSVSSDDGDKPRRRTKSKYDRLPSKTWKNHLDNIQVTAKFFKPRDYRSLYNLVVYAEENNKSLKVVGSGHSYASLCDTDGILIDPHSLDRTTTKVKYCLDPKHTQKEYRHHLVGYDGFELRDVGDTLKRGYVEVENGITLHNLVHYLKHKGLGLLNMGGYDGQTIVGVISTATHGSGITLSCFPDLVKSLVLISTGKIPEKYLQEEDIERQNSNAVNVYRIEPTQPFSKRSTRSKYILVQNDDVFKTAMCTMGTMGVIYSVVLEVGEDYFLASTGELKTLDYALDLIRPSEEREDRLPQILVEKRHVNFYCHVYPLDEDNDVLQDLGGDDPLSHADKHPCLVMQRYFTDDPKKPRTVGAQILRAIKQIRLVGEILQSVVNGDPYELAACNAVSLMKQQVHEQVVVHYPDALLSGNSKDAGYAAEFCVPISKIVDGQKVYTDEYLHTALRVAFNHIYKEFFDQTGYHTYCVQIRFVKESQAYLAMMHGQDSCMLEFQMVNPTTHGIETLQSLSEEFQTNEETRDFIRLHWGLDFDKMPSENYLDRYDEFDTWYEIYASLNEKGTFSNTFTRRVFRN
eukprot:TRINITY_DN5299_c0_g1_i1.p1 TRINITY_DN5299_c0_g1~~TRINITY_DN5299_c0_g1_i1.p1  ORF type:complete len:699 (+),score=178.75 TRINITY_DN5299_c0_g1_i1:24-2099(+)